MINTVCRFTARLAGKQLDHQRYIQSGDIICPEEEVSCPKAIYIDSHLDRIKGAPIYTSLEIENETLKQTSVIHAATVLYNIGPTTLFRGGLWTDKREFVNMRLKDSDQRFRVDIEQAVLVDSDVSNHFFGHWLHDTVPATLIGHSGLQSLAFRKPTYPHAIDYQNILDLSIIYGNQGKVKHLFLLRDFSQNSYKVKRYLQIRSNIIEKLNPIDCKYDGVYIARGTTGAKRTLSNEDALIQHLQGRGFDIVYPEQLTAEALIRRLWNAPVIVSVEGSALAHPIYSIALNGAYLVLQPPNRVNHTHKGMCDAMNRPYGFYVCQPTNDNESFYVDSMTELDRLLGLLQNESVNRKQINN